MIALPCMIFKGNPARWLSEIQLSVFEKALVRLAPRMARANYRFY
jgi:hypothetical protein